MAAPRDELKLFSLLVIQAKAAVPPSPPNPKRPWTGWSPRTNEAAPEPLAHSEESSGNKPLPVRTSMFEAGLLSDHYHSLRTTVLDPLASEACELTRCPACGHMLATGTHELGEPSPHARVSVKSAEVDAYSLDRPDHDAAVDALAGSGSIEPASERRRARLTRHSRVQSRDALGPGSFSTTEWWRGLIGGTGKLLRALPLHKVRQL